MLLRFTWEEEGRTWNTNHEVAHGCDTEIAFRLDEPQCSWNEPVNSISYRKRTCPSDLLVASATQHDGEEILQQPRVYDS